MRRLTLAFSLAAALVAPALAATPAPAAAVPTASAQPSIKAVYHLSDADKARPMLSNIRNHLIGDPGAKIVVVANAGGVDFLLKDAVDKNNNLFAPAIEELARRGVEFRACRNTLVARSLPDTAVVEEATVIPAGVVEVAKLQAREGYVYIKP